MNIELFAELVKLLQKDLRARGENNLQIKSINFYTTATPAVHDALVYSFPGSPEYPVYVTVALESSVDYIIGADHRGPVILKGPGD